MAARPVLVDEHSIASEMREELQHANEGRERSQEEVSTRSSDRDEPTKGKAADSPASNPYHPTQSLASLFPLVSPMNPLSAPLNPTAHPPTSLTPNATFHSPSARFTTSFSSSPERLNRSAVSRRERCFSARLSRAAVGVGVGGMGRVWVVEREEGGKGTPAGRVWAGVWEIAEGRRRARMMEKCSRAWEACL